MKRLFNSLLWILMLALPLQGFAQSGYLSCHREAPAKHSEALDLPMHSGHQSVGPAHLEHEDHMDHGSMQMKEKPSKANLLGKAYKACCTCAANTASSMAPTELAALQAPLGSFVFAPTEPVGFASTSAPPLERPPKV